MFKVGAIEAGGTKFVSGVGSGPADLDVVEIPTAGPEETIGRVIEFFRSRGPLEAVGLDHLGRSILIRNRLLSAILLPLQSWHGGILTSPVRSVRR